MRSCDRHEVPSVVLVPLGLPWLAYLGLPQPINNQVVNPHGCPRTLPEKRGKTNEKHSPGDSYHTRGPHTIDSSKACTKIIDKVSMNQCTSETRIKNQYRHSSISVVWILAIFDLTAVYNSILFSSHLLLLSNLDLRGFCFTMVFLRVPTLTA